MNRISKLLTPRDILLDVTATSKKRLLENAALLFENEHRLERNRVFDSLFARERLGSTGLGGGVAVPHARLAGLEKVCAVFVRLDHPVAYEAVDDRPVDLLFCLFAAPEAGADHLRALAAVSRALRSPELRERLRQARTVDAIRALFVRDTTATAA